MVLIAQMRHETAALELHLDAQHQALATDQFEQVGIIADELFQAAAQALAGSADLGQELTSTPKHKASAFADYTFQTGALAGLGAGLGVRYMGESYGDGANQWRTPSTTLWDAVVHYDFGDWRLQATASNLFDAEYLSRCSAATQCFYGTRGLYAVSLKRSF